MRICRPSLVVIVLFAARVAVGAAEPGAITQEQLAKAETAYRKAFGERHDKLTKTAKAAEKLGYARELLEQSKKPTFAADAALVDVLRRHALEFAPPDTKDGLALALDVHKANLAVPPRRLGALEKYAELSGKAIAFEPAAARPKLAGEAVKACRDAAAELEKAGDPAAALAAVKGAMAVTTKYIPKGKDALAALAADEKRLDLLAQDQKDLDHLKQRVEKTPADAKSRVALGCGLLRLGRVKEAADQFRATGANDWAALADATAADDRPAAAAERCVKLADTLPGDDKKSRAALLEYARTRYEACRLTGAWSAALPGYLDLLEKLAAAEPAAGRTKLAAAQVDALIELGDLTIEKGDAADVAAVAKRARAALKLLPAGEVKELKADVDAIDQWVVGRQALEGELKRWADAAAKGPLDPKGSRQLAVTLLRLGKNGDAAAAFEAADKKAYAALAGSLAAGDKADRLKLANELLAAAADFRNADRDDVRALARVEFEAALSGSNPVPDRPAVELQAVALPDHRVRRAKLPNGVYDVFADVMPGMTKFAATTKSPGTVEQSRLRGVVCVTASGDQVYLPPPRARVLIADAPKEPHEYRYVGFLWRRVSGDGNASGLFVGSKDRDRGARYTNGERTADAVLLAPPMSGEWSAVVRDLYRDWNGVGEVGELHLLSRGNVVQYAGLVFGRTPEAVTRALAQAKLIK